MAGLLNFFYTQLFVKLPYPTHSFSGQTIIVTGSNTGLGLEAARHFTRLGAAKVILAVRSLSKGEAAKESIENSTDRKGVVEVWHLDLGNYESVKEFAKKAEGLARLDILVENAGIAREVWSVLEDNEATITTNVVSTFLLGLLLLPKLRESGQKFDVTPRVVVTCSEVHAWSSFTERKSENIFDALNDKESANMADRYQVSKLLQVYPCRELATRARKSGKSDVIINYLNPGLCHSELARDSGFGLAVLKFLFARSTEHGSRSLVNAAEAGEETNGEYLSDCHIAQPGPLVTSEEGPEIQKKVWDELSAKLEKIQPGIMGNV
ncbi:hypothetical protein HO133_006544 [Letharia lupina]|uniref:Uncharacterized protein n=1 Tax=Letharia lupina TaxID=560253 RepID=A0A8H6F6W6_9LECA|nr:uncharacterized protein HO133_006544 [Letharia lupina]KAF6217717.1 hypothetical protein HO133_006544 [Letharia lupina]